MSTAPKTKKVKDTRVKVFGYCRVSTDRQKHDGESFATQSHAIMQYAASKNLNVIEIYTETCSGTVDMKDRPIMTQILKMIREGQATGIVVSKLDRFSRKMVNLINILAQFNDEKIGFYCCNPDIDTSTTSGKFMMQLLGSIAEMERNMIADRVRETMARMKADNMLVGSVPFGKKMVIDETTKKKMLVDDEREQEVIKRIKELRATMVKNKKGVSKPLSYQKICDILEEDLVDNKNGHCKWHPSQIRRICFDGSYKSRPKNGEEEDEDDEEES